MKRKKNLSQDMKVTLKQCLKKLLPPSMRSSLKRWSRKVRNIFKKNEKKTSIEDLRSVLVDVLGVKRGDKIFVTSGFGSLNADFSPNMVIDLLIDLIGPNGVIVMPYYPPMNSSEWANTHSIFDMRHTKSGMGILTNEFSKRKGVVKTMHPTKSLCVMGDLKHIDDHYKAVTPFYWDSPYGEMLEDGWKSLGLGVKNIPIMHAIEDILSDPCTRYYQEKIYELSIIDQDGRLHKVNTLVHDDNVMSRCSAPGDYVKSLCCRSYKRVNFGFSFVYVIENKNLFEESRKAFLEGYTRESLLRK